MSRHRLGTLLGLSFALCLPLACGEDNDILRQDQPAPVADPQTQDPNVTDPNVTDPNLTDPNQLNSGGEVCEVSACGTPPAGAAACCTSEEDVTAIRALEAGKCGVDMTALGFPGCSQKDQPGTLDAACPEVPLGPPGAPPLPGCCTPSGHCGAMETFMGFGCTSSPDPTTWIPCGG